MTAHTATNLRPLSAEALGVAEASSSVALPGTAPLPAPVPLRPANVTSVTSAPQTRRRQGFSDRTFAQKRWVELADAIGAAFAVALTLSLFGAKSVLVLAIASIPLSLVVFKAGGLHAR